MLVLNCFSRKVNVILLQRRLHGNLAATSFGTEFLQCTGRSDEQNDEEPNIGIQITVSGSR